MSRNDDVEREKFGIATHLFARLRRSSGRSIDLVWMLHDEPYAREVLGLAFASADVQMHEYATRYSELLGPRPQARPEPAAARPAPGPNVDSPGPERPLNRYVGSLR